MTYCWKCPLKQCTERAETSSLLTPPRCHKDGLMMVRDYQGEDVTFGKVKT